MRDRSVQSNLHKAGLRSNMDWIQLALSSLPWEIFQWYKLPGFLWVTCCGAYLLSVKRICVQHKFPSLDRRTSSACYLSCQPAGLKHLSPWLSLFHTEKSYFYLAFPWREAVLRLLIIFEIIRMKTLKIFLRSFFFGLSLI